MYTHKVLTKSEEINRQRKLSVV